MSEVPETVEVKRAQLQILLHGVIVLLIGLLCGVPYGHAITHGWGEDAVRAWRFAHLGLLVGGIWLLAVAGVSHLLVLNARTVSVLAWSLVASAYGFTVALVLAAVSGVRGLEPTGPFANFVVFLANAVGAFGALVGVVLMVVGTRAALCNAARG